MSGGHTRQKLEDNFYSQSLMDSDDDLGLFVNVSSSYSPSFSQPDDVALLTGSSYPNDGQFLLVPQSIPNDSLGESACGDLASLGTHSDVSRTDNLNDNTSVSQASCGGRLQHSEIEKRRRDKMNMYISELSNMVPMCHSMNRKLDKLTVLRMTVQQLKTLKGNTVPCTEASQRPAFLSDEDLKHLILKVADGFLFVLACERGRFLYVSESVKNILEYNAHELVGQSIFDVIHSRDVAMVKEHLLSSDVSPKEKLIDAKTLLPIKAKLPKNYTRLCSGSRRSFHCRFKLGAVNARNGNAGKRIKTENKRYTTLHCTGYIKSWASQENDCETSDPFSSNGDDDCSSQLACLVMIGRPIPPFVNREINSSYQFVTRHGLDGKFSYIDPRATPLLGFLPQELLGTSIYEYVHQEDVEVFAHAHRKAIHKGSLTTPQPAGMRLRSKWGVYLALKTHMCCFYNPLTDEPEFLICRHSLPSDDPTLSEVMRRGINIWIESAGSQQDRVSASINSNAARVGSSIAEEIYELQRSGETEFLKKMTWQCIRQYAECNSNVDNDKINIDSHNTAASNLDLGHDQRNPVEQESQSEHQLHNQRQSGASSNSHLSTESAGKRNSDSCLPSNPSDIPTTSQSSGVIDLVPMLSGEPVTSRDYRGIPTSAGNIGGGSSDLVLPTSVTPSMNVNQSSESARRENPQGITSHRSHLHGSRPNGLTVHLPDTIEIRGLSNSGTTSNTLTNTLHDRDSRTSSTPPEGRNIRHSTEAAHVSASMNNGANDNDEAAMAVVMSLLEADAGLGGPVDLSNMPWPL